MLNVYKLEKFARGIIYILVFFPFIIIPYTLWPFVFTPSLIFYFLAAVLSAIILISLFKDRHNISFKSNNLIWIILGYVILMAISGIFGADFQNSFFGFGPRMGGILGYIALFAWFLSVLFFLRTKEQWNFFIKILVISSVLVVLASVASELLLENVTLLPQKHHISFLDNRLAGILGNPIFLAGYIFPHIFLSAIFSLKEKNTRKRIVWAALSVFLLLVVFLTQTRGTILSLFAAFAFLLIFYIHEIIKKKEKIFVRFLAAIIPLAGLGIYIFLNKPLLSKLADTAFSSATTATRFIIWKTALGAFFDKWLLGWGPENFSYAFSKFYDAGLLKFSFYETWVDKPHNQFLEVFATLGAMGGILFLGVFGAAFFMIYKLIKKDAANKWAYLFLGAIVFVYAGHIFFAFDTIHLRLIIFAMFAFLIFSYNSIFDNQPKVSPNILKIIAFASLFIIVFSLKNIGIQTVKASFYTSGASEAIKSNSYGDIKRNILGLSKTKSPYNNGNWEYLADIILKADAVKKIPVAILREILPKAVAALEGAAKDQPDNFSYSYRLAQMYNLSSIYVNQNYADKALDWAKKAENISPNRQVAGILLGQIYFQKRDLDKGIELLLEMIKKNPKVSEPYWFASILYDAKGDYDNSYVYMTTAVELGRAPKNISDEILYVAVLGRQKDYVKMAPIYESIIKKDNTNAKWQANLATVYLELKEYEKARAAARQAIFLDPKFGDEGEKFLKKVDKAEAGN